MVAPLLPVLGQDPRRFASPFTLVHLLGSLGAWFGSRFSRFKGRDYRTRLIAVITVMIVVTLACSIQGSPTTTQDPGLVQTQVSMAMTQTAMRSQSQIDLPEPTQDNGLVSTQVALAMTQTALANPPALPTNTIAFPTAKPTQEPTATQQDIKSLIDNSNILVYEDMIDYPEYITVVNKALKSVGGHHKYVGDAIGTLMTQLNSGTDWDLIIIAAEGRGAISGDYWDVIKNQVDDGVGLIAELWYLDDIGAGHSGLENIAHLNPRYLKFDMDLVRDIDKKPIKHEMARALKTFADKMDSQIIAEGNERKITSRRLH